MDLEGLIGEALRLLRNQDVVFFLGAGASFGTDREREKGEGLPLGRELAGAIASEFDVDDQGGDLRKVASVAAAKKAGTAAVKRFVAEEVSSRARSPLAAHRALARIRPLLVMTTNYDDLYEKALRELDERPAKIMSPEDLVHLPRDRPRVVKLHGDAGSPNSLVLTGADYLDWEGNVEGLFADVTAEFQRSSCVFVGYGLGDDNLRRIIGLVRKRLKGYAPKHYALVHRIDEGTAAEFGDSVEFVEGDATAFLESLAYRREREAPGPFDLGAEEGRFSEAVRDGSFEEAAASCERLQGEYLRRGAINTAAYSWGRLATAAEEEGEESVAAVARTKAGALYMEAGDDPSAEVSLERALEHAKAANMPPQEQEITPLLRRARLSGGDYYRVLRDTDEALGAQGDDAAPDLLHELYSGRAEAKEALGDDDGALQDLRAALEALPREDMHARARTRCGIARVLASRAQWGAAREELDRAGEELPIAPASSALDTDARRAAALIRLVRANVHQALGEDAEAVELYEGCQDAFSETGDAALLISALRGSMYSRQLLGDFDLEAARARLRDHLKDSPEYQKIEDKEGQGITALAANRLAEARTSLLQAMIAAQRVHDVGRERGLRHWYADVLLAAGDHAGALEQYVLAGDGEKSGEVAGRLTQSAFEDRATFDGLVSSTEEAAFEGNLPARAAALAALTAATDVLPASARASLAGRLSAMDELPAGSFADRNLLSDAAELAEGVAPVLTDEQALSVGRGIVRAVRRTDCSRPTYARLCSALSSLAVGQAGAVGELDVPVERLAELVGGDLINDTQGAMAALVNLARVGHRGAKEKALELARSGDTPWHVRWRHWLGDAPEQERARTLLSALPGSIDRVQQMENGFQFGIGGLSPMFFQGWDLPEEVRAEVAVTLSEAAADPSALIHSRGEAATMLGLKADQLGEDGRRRAIQSLLPLLTGEVDVHPVARSIDNPLSAVIMNVGQPDDVKAAAAYSLLRLSRWMSEDQRKLLMRDIEKLRASQVETFGVSVSGGLRHFEPEDAEEQRWLQTRLLLLMNAPHAKVRDNAARCVGLMAGDGVLEFDPELLDTVLHLASSALMSDRVGASHALSGAQGNEGWSLPEVADALEGLAQDRSFRVRTATQPPDDVDGRAREQAS